MKRAGLFLIILFLIACEEIPEETTEEIIKHRVSLEIDKISSDPVFPGAILNYNYTLLNIGREDIFDVALETRMRKKTTGEIVKTEGEIVSMALVSFKEKGIMIPQNSAKGEYELTVVGTYDEGTDSDSFTFTVDREEEEVNESLKNETAKNTTKPELKVVLEEAAPEKKTEAAAPKGPVVRVVIQNYQYNPSVLNITVGTTVEWYNNDTVPHSASGAGFDSGPLPKGETFSFTFTKPIIKIYSSTYTEIPSGKIIVHE